MGDGRIIGTFIGDEINESSITACYLQTAASGRSSTTQPA
jgi:hypothetical protein